MNESNDMILCIPGPWETRRQLIRALIEISDGRYLMAGHILLDSTTNDSLKIDWEPHDPRMADAFRASSHTEETVSEVCAHRSVVYLHFPLNVREQRERILKYTDILRKAGGIAIKLENSGLSHPWCRWFEWLSAPFENAHYLAFVIHAWDDCGGYSCGMHHFGLPDAITDEGGVDGLTSLQAFNQYMLMESPDLRSGHTFSKDDDSPRFRLEWADDDRFAPGELYHNPFGLWRLTAI